MSRHGSASSYRRSDGVLMKSSSYSWPAARLWSCGDDRLALLKSSHLSSATSSKASMRKLLYAGGSKAVSACLSCISKDSTSSAIAAASRETDKNTLTEADHELQLISFEKPPSYYHPTLWKDDFIESLQGEQVDEDEINDLIEEVRGMFRTMGDGATAASAYDTAWVARVPSLDGRGSPQFPLTLQWIVDNQLEDGSWGEKELFLAYDRVFNTLACVLALQTWNVGEESITKGLDFMRRCVNMMKDEAGAHMPSGFEICFISMLEEAKQMGLDLPYDLPFIKGIQEAREKKLQRIPIDYFHTRPTTILYSLEGLQSLVDWNRILDLQSPDGSFLSSPASTACVLMHTGNQKCLDFLNSVLPRFNNAVPCHYPLDLFERLWAIDGLMRLGVDRFFQTEIKQTLDYVYKYMTETGIGWARENPVHDIDDTCMAFRILRLHGYDVSPKCIEHFKSEGKFFCFAGESRHGVTEMLNLYRASQLRFPGETILEESHSYSKAYLANAVQTRDAFDKWALKKDLEGEVEYALKFPWHRSVPRLEARTYVQQYGADDMWLGKTMYRMYNVSNQTFLELGIADFNRCQAIHQKELQQINRWWNQSGFAELSFTRQRPAEMYFSIAACMFEPEFAALRLAYTKTACITVILDDLFDSHASVPDLKLFLEAVKRWDPSVVNGLSEDMKVSFNGLYSTLNSFVEDAFEVQGRDISGYLRTTWEDLLSAYILEAEWSERSYVPKFEEYIENAKVSIALGTVILNSIFFCGEPLPDHVLQQLDFRSNFLHLVCLTGRLINDTKTFEAEKERGELASSISCYMNDNPSVSEEESKAHVYGIIDAALKELNWELVRPNNVPLPCKRLLFNTARVMQLFYMVRDGFGISDMEMKGHLHNVLFQQVSV
uniref:Levopimaradiene synthase n=1 Tax=Phylloglossum drummondii TaxID=70003 RepID=A0A8U0DD35_PHYDU|nr:levopimaradiene synthase [Phylloglossum drummondii]